jgi:hypothetical protein
MLGLPRTMKIKLLGQLRGPECRVVMREIIAARRALEPWFANLRSDSISKLTIILRVDGSLGSFGPPGVENTKLRNGEIECDLVIEGPGWESLSPEKLSSIVRKQIVGAIHHCLVTFDVKHDPNQLEEAILKT